MTAWSLMTLTPSYFLECILSGKALVQNGMVFLFNVIDIGSCNARSAEPEKTHDYLQT